MRTRLLRRVLQALLLPLLIVLVVEWAWNPKYGHLVYLGWSTVLTSIILFLGPWWINRPKQSEPLLDQPRHLGMSLLIYGLFLITSMPVITIWAVLWAGLSIYSGGSLMINGQLAAGLVFAAVPVLGVMALYSLWALARFYVRVPRENPPQRELIRYGIGLCVGVSVVVFIWTVGDIWNWGDLAFSYVALSCLSPLIVTMFFLLLMLFNWIYPLRPNSSLNTDALEARRLAQR